MECLDDDLVPVVSSIQSSGTGGDVTCGRGGDVARDEVAGSVGDVGDVVGASVGIGSAASKQWITHTIIISKLQVK